MNLSYRQGDSFLHRLTPASKLVANLFLLAAVTLAFDPLTPLAFLLVSLVASSRLGRIPLADLLRRLAPFAGLSLSFVLMNAFFHRQIAPSPVLWSWGPALVTQEGLVVGLSVGLRILCVVSFGLSFVLTTDPRDMALSLVQQFRLNYRLGYAVLVAYRLLPVLQSELLGIQAAQQVRGVKERGGPVGRLRRLRGYALPLLVGAVRRAERIAVAMDSRAFGAYPDRTYLRSLSMGTGDRVFVICVLALSLGITLTLWRIGLWRGPGVGPA